MENKKYYELYKPTESNVEKIIQDHAHIILKEEKTYKATKKGYSTKIDSVKRSIYSPRNYNLYIDSIPFFNDPRRGVTCRVTGKGATAAGYIPTRVTTTFKGIEKKVATFKIIDLKELWDNAGFREKYRFINAITWEQVGAPTGYDVVTFINADGCSADYNIITGRWDG